MSSSYQYVIANKRAGYAEIALNRPDRMNALGMGPGSNRAELVHAIAEADSDPDVGCILLRAEGKSFCAGGDVKMVSAREDAYDDLRFGADLAVFHDTIRNTRKPLIAAVHGLCLGAGMSLVAQCDIVLAADTARFGLVEGRMGWGGSAEIVPLVGAAWAKYLIFTGEMIDAATAQAIGLVFHTLPEDELAAKATDLALRLGRMPRESLILNKREINAIEDASGLAAGRIAGVAQEGLLRSAGKLPKAPDGRSFMDIIREGGMGALKQARELQYKEPWLPAAGDRPREK